MHIESVLMMLEKVQEELYKRKQESDIAFRDFDNFIVDLKIKLQKEVDLEVSTKTK